MTRYEQKSFIKTNSVCPPETRRNRIGNFHSLRFSGTRPRGRKVAFKMIHSDDRLARKKRERSSGLNADTKSCGESGTLRDGDCVENNWAQTPLTPLRSPSLRRRG